MYSVNKKISALVAALLLAGTLAACGAEPTPVPVPTATTAAAAAPTDTVAVVEATATSVVEAATATTATPAGGQCPAEVVIGWAPPDITGVFKTATDYFEKAAADATAAGIKTTVISRSPATHVAFADQVAIIEDYIQRKVNVIAISPAEVEVVKPAIAKANAAGIPVIIVNLLEPIEGIEVASYIGFDNADAAKISAYAVLDYFGGPGVLGNGDKITVAPEDYLDLAWWEEQYANVDKASIQARGSIIEGVAGGFFSAARLQGFNEVLGQYPGVEIVGAPCAADWNREKGVRCAEDILQSNPTNLDFIWAASNEMGLGAMLASESAGRLETAGTVTTGDNTVAVFTNDVTPESTDRIREGKLIAETHHGFPEWGWFGTEFATTLACGGTVPDIYDIRPRTVYQGNADQFYPNPVLPEIDWEAIKKGESPRGN
jgi:ribose transport system substrate-binding protein